METQGFSPIAAKWRIPATREAAVHRPRLHRLLQRCVRTRVTVIAAPAGSGKTTLLAEWSRRSQTPVAWVSLDAADNEPLRFWTYVAGALDAIEAGLSRRLGALLQLPQWINGEYLVTALTQAVADVTDDFVLVLDDYHLITDDAIHAALALLIDYLPVSMHLVLASRSEPPLPLARWRARGQLGEFAAAELRFSVDETRALAPDLPPQDAERLQMRTEGWAAGLQLALLAARHTDPPALSALPDFQGGHPYVADYLATEVLAQQPDPIRAFLLQTSILETLDGDGCAAVTGRADSRALLETLYRRNLFIAAVNSKGVYRYHALFADFLRAQLAEQADYDPAALHRRAAEWYEGRGALEPAFRHRLAAGDTAEALRLLEVFARDYVLRGEFASLRRCFEALPERLRFIRPSLCLFYAWVLTNAGQGARAEAYLAAVARAAADDRRLQGEAAVVYARGAVLRGDTGANIHFSREALALLPEDSMMRADVALGLAFAHSDRQAFETARAYFEEAVARAHAMGNQRTVMLALYYLANTYRLEGQLHAAARCYRRGLDAFGSDSASALTGWMYAGLGALSYEWNDLAPAVEQLQTALALAQQCGEVKVLIYARLPLASALYAQGQPGAALDALQAAAEVAAQANIPSLRDEVDEARMALWLRIGEREMAGRWLRSHGISPAEGDGLSEAALTMLALYHLAQRPASTGTLHRLQELIAGRRESCRARGLIAAAVRDSLLLTALALSLGQRSAAAQALSTAVSLAQPGGFLRSWVDFIQFADSIEAGAGSIQALLRELARDPQRAEFIGRVLSAFGEPLPTAPVTVSTAVRHAAPMEPLRPREIEMLRHLADGRSNQEIAEEMIMAVSTVKWYLRNLYDKLQVNRRTQALARARELHLI